MLREQLEIAETLLAAGAFAEAESAYRRTIEEAPQHVAAHIGASRCARKRGDRQASLAYLAAALGAYPANIGLRIELAADLHELGQLDAAEEQYRQVLGVAPGNVRAHIGLGHCARKRGDRGAAMAIFRSVSVLAPAEPGPRIELAADLHALGQLEAAEEQYRQVIGLAPGNVRAHIGLGHCARKRGDREAAMAIFQTVVALAPAEPGPRIELAAELRELGQMEAAEEQYRRVIGLAPGNVRAPIGLGQCARKRGDRHAAMAWFQLASEASPLEAAPRLEIAVEHRDAGDPDAAIKTARGVLAEDPGNLPALMSTGISERYAGRHEAAFAAFSEAHRASPTQAAPLVEMAMEQRMMGRQAACDELLARALRCDSTNVAVINRLAEQAMLASDFVAAAEIYERAILAQPGELTFHLGAAEAWARQGRMADALAALTALREARGPMPAIDAKRANLLRQSGDYAGALCVAREATVLAPHAFECWVVRFSLEMLVGSDAEVELCLSKIRPSTLHQRATLAHLRGLFAEAQWRYDDAIRCYDMAAAMNPSDDGVQHSLVRSRILTFDLAGAKGHLRRLCARTAYVTKLQKKSSNMSQSLYGQLLEEFCLDHFLAGSLAATQKIPSSLRIAALRQEVLGNPDSTAAAIGLMIALRQSGAFARPVDHPSDPEGRIPRRIMQFWDSENLPEDVARLMTSWADRNPDYACHVFHDETARAYLKRRHPAAVLAAYRRAQEAAQKSDIFRLAWLAAEGGVYADADDRASRPLGSCIPGHAELVLYQEDVASIGNNFIAAQAGHPVVTLALTWAVEAINRGDTDNVWLSTGPALLTRALATHLATGEEGRIEVPKGIVVFDRRDLNHAVAMNCMLGYKSSTRNWANSVFAKQRRAS
jgi:tetratricopeptide (TPR) repeat protein